MFLSHNSRLIWTLPVPWALVSLFPVRFVHDETDFVRGGDKRDRTVDLLLAKQALSQLSYTPMTWKLFNCLVLLVPLLKFPADTRACLTTVPPAQGSFPLLLHGGPLPRALPVGPSKLNNDKRKTFRNRPWMLEQL